MASMNDIRKAIGTLDAMRAAIEDAGGEGEVHGAASRDGCARAVEGSGDWPARPNYLKFFYDCLTGPPDPKFQL